MLSQLIIQRFQLGTNLSSEQCELISRNCAKLSGTAMLISAR